ncbi:MAG: response regulator, partial [Magnetococcales bacterium]|nr:response regulator [Magnetococcales bacterium]
LVSEVGRGSLFTLTLPLDTIETSSLPASGEAAPHEDRDHRDIDAIPDDRRRLGPDDRAILLVGMDYHRIRALGETARSLGLGVIVAGDQSAALFLANFLKPVGLIMAGDLPGVSTLPLIRRLKTTANRDSLPVLYLHPANAPPPAGEELADKSIQIMPMIREIESTSEACQRFLKAVIHAPLDPQQSPVPHLPPEEADSAIPAPTTPSPQPESDLSGRYVLLIDDDIRNVFALTSLLEEKGCHVIMAENGKTALDLLQRQPLLDMILLDIMMPDMNGYELLGEIRRHPSWRDTPMLVLTAKAMQGERQRCLEAGASDYLSKPVDTQKLLSMMRPWLDRNR